MLALRPCRISGKGCKYAKAQATWLCQPAMLGACSVLVLLTNRSLWSPTSVSTLLAWATERPTVHCEIHVAIDTAKPYDVVKGLSRLELPCATGIMLIIAHKENVVPRCLVNVESGLRVWARILQAPLYQEKSVCLSMARFELLAAT